jgi:hypothetical protein
MSREDTKMSYVLKYLPEQRYVLASKEEKKSNKDILVSILNSSNGKQTKRLGFISSDEESKFSGGNEGEEEEMDTD